MKFTTKIFITFYILNYCIQRFIAKGTLAIKLPILDSFTLFECVEKMLTKRSGSPERALKNGADYVERTIPFESICSAESAFFTVAQMVIPFIASGLTLLLDWNFMWLLLNENVWILLALLFLPGFILSFIVDLPSKEDEETAVLYVKEHSTKECFTFCLCYLLIVLLLCVLFVIMLYIIFFIMRGDVSSYDAIRMFFQNPMCGFNK